MQDHMFAQAPAADRAAIIIQMLLVVRPALGNVDDTAPCAPFLVLRIQPPDVQAAVQGSKVSRGRGAAGRVRARRAQAEAVAAAEEAHPGGIGQLLARAAAAVV